MSQSGSQLYWVRNVSKVTRSDLDPYETYIEHWKENVGIQHDIMIKLGKFHEHLQGFGSTVSAFSENAMRNDKSWFGMDFGGTAEELESQFNSTKEHMNNLSETFSHLMVHGRHLPTLRESAFNHVRLQSDQHYQKLHEGLLVETQKQIGDSKYAQGKAEGKYEDQQRLIKRQDKRIKSLEAMCMHETSVAKKLNEDIIKLNKALCQKDQHIEALENEMNEDIIKLNKALCQKDQHIEALENENKVLEHDNKRLQSQLVDKDQMQAENKALKLEIEALKEEAVKLEYSNKLKTVLAVFGTVWFSVGVFSFCIKEK